MPIIVLETPSIRKTELVAQVAAVPSWMDPFISYLQDGILLDDRDQVRSLCLQAARYFFKYNALYKHGISTPILRCLREDEAKQDLIEVHKGLCGNHSRGHVLAHKVLRMGYY